MTEHQRGNGVSLRRNKGNIHLLIPEYKKLIASTKRVRQFAYAPYSKFKVGSAVLTFNGKIYTGCNVENASYGLSICAERVAIAKAVTAGERKIRAIATVLESKESVGPCGACRQVISEFVNDVRVIMVTLSGKNSKQKFLIKKISQMIPYSFNRSQLNIPDYEVRWKK